MNLAPTSDRRSSPLAVDPHRRQALCALLLSAMTALPAGFADDRNFGDLSLEELMNETVTRVVIFDTDRCPIFVIRKKLIPAAWTDAAGKLILEGRTIQQYLEGDGGKNATDAAQFGFVGSDATIDDARGVMREVHTADVFVTLTGQKSEAALGWLTDDILLA